MNARDIVQAYETLRAEYRQERAEARACGYDFPSFEDWSGQDSPKARAEARWLELEERDELDLY